MNQPTEVLLAAANALLQSHHSALVAKDVVLAEDVLVVRLARSAVVEGEWRDTSNERELDMVTLMDWWQRERPN